MPDSPFSEHFYTGNESYSAEIKSAIDGISGPPKRMPNDLVNDARVHNMQIPSDANMARSGFHTFSSYSSMTSAKNSREIAARDALFARENKKRASEDILFFKSVSSNGATISKDYLPPPLPQTSRNPIIISEEQVKSDYIDELSDDDENDYSAKTASGQWTSPVVKEALRRQVSKEKQFKNFWTNVARLFTLHLTLLLVDYCIKLYNVKYYDVNTVYRNTWWTRMQATTIAGYATFCIQKAYSHVVHLQWILVAVIFVNLLKLLKPQDQCWDLPLTESQRKLIGLSSSGHNSSEDEQDSAFVLKQRAFANHTSSPLVVPKYPKTNKSSGIIHKVRDVDVEDEIALQNIIPRRRLVHQNEGL